MQLLPDPASNNETILTLLHQHIPNLRNLLRHFVRCDELDLKLIASIFGVLNLFGYHVANCFRWRCVLGLFCISLRWVYTDAEDGFGGGHGLE